MARIPRRLAGIGASDISNAAEFDSYIGPAREVTVDPERGIIAVHNGITPGGRQLNVGLSGLLTPQFFGAVGDGVTSDTAAWTAFLAAEGVKCVPPGNYLVNGRLLTYNSGVLGNGFYDTTTYAHPELSTAGGNKLKDSLLVHRRKIDNGQDSLYSGPSIVTQTQIKLEVPNTETAFTNFKQFYGSTHELVLDGYYNFQDDGNHNYSTGCFSNRNRMAGLMGSTAVCAYSYDAKETENGHIDGGAALVAAGTITQAQANTLYPIAMGATKTGTSYFQTTRRARYDSGGYTLAIEVYSLNQSDDADTDVPYLNNDTGSFTSFDYSLKLTAGGAGAPIASAMAITGLGSKHGYYNGINIGGSAFRINNDTQGPAGTVSISGVTQRAATGFSEYFIKYGENKRHHYYVRENAKSRSAQHRFMYEVGSSGLSIECGNSASYSTYIYFRQGVDTSKDGNYSGQTMRGDIEASVSAMTVTSTAGVVRLKPNDTTSSVGYEANTVRFAPYAAANGIPHLGGADRRWNTIYATNATISTSDERKKTPLENIPDALLDAWGEVEFGRYKMLDAVAVKGDGARWHIGVIAQRFIEACERHGLNAFDYAPLCFDRWEATPEETLINRVKTKEPVYEQVLFRPESKMVNKLPIEDAVYEQILVSEESVDEVTGEIIPAKYIDGKLLKEAVYETHEYVVPAEYVDGEELEPAVYDELVTVIPGREAGEIYGIRYEEALCLEAAYQRRRADRIEDRLTRIETLLAA